MAINRYLKFTFLVATALTGSFGAPAFAQDDQGATEASGNDIIVTARRTEERLQDVPISITVFTPAQIAQRNIVSPVDLATYTPSLTTNQRFGPEKSSFVIRGFTQESNTAPSVGVYFADVTAPRAQGGTQTGNGAVAGSFMDLQNVQVLKGPQGTLQGRNTTGGAVLLVPQKPTDSLEGFVEGTLGDYDLKRVQAVLNVPLADTFKVRVAVDRNQRDGYMRNLSGIGPKAYNDVNYFAARLSVVADLTPDLENYTIATYSHSFGVGYAARTRDCNPTLLAARSAIARAGCAQLARQTARGDGLLDVDVNNPDPKIDLRQWQVINTTTWKASDTLTIKNIASYAEFYEGSTFSLNSDNFVVPDNPANAAGTTRFLGAPGSPFRTTNLTPSPGENQAAQSTFTEELQFQGRTDDGRFTWQAGAYLEVSKPLGYSTGYSATNIYCTDLANLLCTAPLSTVNIATGAITPSGQLSATATKTSFNNKGFYAQATYELTDQLSFTGGIRYTIDDMRQIASNRRMNYVPALGRFAFSCNTPGITNAIDVTRETCTQNFRSKSKRPTWLLGVDFKPTNDVLLYAKWSRGYRQGGINANNVGFETWGPEKVDAYEVGAKTSFRGQSVRGFFNIAGFWNDFTDQQLTVSFVPRPPNQTNATAIINAGKSRIRGIEADASVTLFDSLQFDVGYAYLDTKTIAIVQPDLTGNVLFESVLPSVTVGSPLTFSPKNRVTATATYTLPLDESIGRISLGATFTHTGSQRSTAPASSPRYLNPATDLLNLNIDWRDVMGQPIDLAFFMTNVTNQIYEVGIAGGYVSSGFEQTLFGPPRMFGFRMKYRFGN